METTQLELLREKARKVLNEFDYETVHAYMVSTNHTWHFNHRYNEGYVNEVPPIAKLKVTARRLMDVALMAVFKSEHSTHCGTGGLNVYIFPEWGGVKLSYEITKFCCKTY